MPATILITSNDRPVPPSPGRWLRGEGCVVNDVTYTVGGEANTNKFYQYEVTDAVEADLIPYLETWNRAQNSVVLAGPTTQFTFTSLNINVSETIGEWTVPITVALLDEWNTGFDINNNPNPIISTDSVTNTAWTCSGLTTAPQALTFEAFVVDWGLSDMLKRTIWTVTPAGMTSIQGNGGLESGTLLQFEAIIEDGRLN
jgi:hypothetical protein